MAADKNVLSGNTAMLLLKLLESKDMYGYQIIEEMARRSLGVFNLKTGTLYPVLHGLEREGMVESYEDNADSARIRRYYSLTGKGRSALKDKEAEWTAYTAAVSRVMDGGVGYAWN